MSGGVQPISVARNIAAAFPDSQIGQLVLCVVCVGTCDAVWISDCSQVTDGIIGVAGRARIGFGNACQTVESIEGITDLRTTAIEGNQSVCGVVSVGKRPVWPYNLHE